MMSGFVNSLVITFFRPAERFPGVALSGESQLVIPDAQRRCSVTAPIPGMWIKGFFNIKMIVEYFLIKVNQAKFEINYE